MGANQMLEKGATLYGILVDPMIDGLVTDSHLLFAVRKITLQSFRNNFRRPAQTELLNNITS